MAPNKTYELKAVFTAEDNSGKAVNSMAARLEKLEKKLDKMDTHLNVTVTETGADEVERKLEDLEKRTKGVKTAKVKAEYDDNGVEKNLKALDRQIGAISKGVKHIKLADNSDSVRANIKTLEGQLNNVNKALWKVRLSDNTEEVKQKASSLSRHVDNVFKGVKNVKLGIEKGDFDAKLSESKNRLAILTQRPHEAKIGANINDFNRDLAHVRKQLDDEIRRVNTIEIRASAKGFTEVAAQARAIKQELDNIKEAKINLDTSDFDKARILAGATAKTIRDELTGKYRIEIDTSSMSRAKLVLGGLSSAFTMFIGHLRNAGNISQDFAKFVYVGQQAMYVFGIAVMAVAIGALGPLVAGLSIAIFSLGALAGGLGLAAAAAAPLVKAFAEQEQNANKLKSAQDSLKSSAEGVRTANNSLADAQRNVTDTQRQGIESINSAIQAHKEAQRGVIDAQRAVGEAHQGVTDAMVSRQESITSAVESHADAVRNLNDAILSRQESINSAHESYKDAVEAVHEAVLDRQESIKNAYDAHADAIRSLNDAIENRQERISSALESQRDAVRAVADAIVSRREAIKSAIDSHADALRGVSDAQRGVMDAQRNFVDAQRASRDATMAFNDALQTEKYRIQDLKYEIQGLALDSRELALDLADAREELAKASNAEERERAQIRLERLMLREKQLTDDQREAQLALNDAQKNGTKELQNAAKARKDANRREIDAKRAIADAERDLRDARKAAIEAEQDIAKARRDGDRQVADAREAAIDAEKALQKARRDGDRDVADARKAVLEAEQDIMKARRDGDKQVADAREAALKAEQNIAKARRDGDRQVADARRAMLKAEQAIVKARRDGDRQVADARKQVADAQRALVDANRKAMESERAIGKARADAARANADAMRGMIEAQRRLADAQAKHRSALEEVNALLAKTTGITAAVLAKGKELGAAYRQAFAQATHSAGLLAIKMMDLGIRVMPILGRTANETILGIDAGLTKVGQNYAAYGVLDSMRNILSRMPGITQAWTVAFGNFGGAFLNIMSQAMPYAQRFANYIARTGERFMRWTDSAKGRADIKRFFDAAAPVAKALFRQIARIGGALLRWSITHPEAVAAAINKLGDIVMGAAKWVARLVRFWKALPEPIRDVAKAVAGFYVVFRLLPRPLRLAALWMGRLLLGAGAGAAGLGIFGNKAGVAAKKTGLLRRAAVGAAGAIGAKGLARQLRTGGAAAGTLGDKAGKAGAKVGAKGMAGSVGTLASRIGLRFLPVVGQAILVLDALSLATGNGHFGVQNLRDGIRNFAKTVGADVPPAGEEFKWLKTVIVVAGGRIKDALGKAFKPQIKEIRANWGQVKRDFDSLANTFRDSWAGKMSKALLRPFDNFFKKLDKGGKWDGVLGRWIGRQAPGLFKEVDRQMATTNKKVKKGVGKAAKSGGQEYGKLPKRVKGHNESLNKNIDRSMDRAKRDVRQGTAALKKDGTANIRGFKTNSSDVMKAYKLMVKRESNLAKEHSNKNTGNMRKTSLRHIKDLNKDGTINMREMRRAIALQTLEAKKASNKNTDQQKRTGNKNLNEQREKSSAHMKDLMHKIDANTKKGQELSDKHIGKMRDNGIKFSNKFRGDTARAIAEAAHKWARNTLKGAQETVKYLVNMARGAVKVIKELGISWKGLKEVAKQIPVIGTAVRVADFFFAKGGTYEGGEAKYAAGGKRQAPTGGVATGPTRVYGEVPGTKEYYITDNPRYRKRNLELLADANEHMMARSGGFYKANRKENTPPGPQHWDSTPPNANARRHMQAAGNRGGRQEGFGYTMYTLVKPLKKIADTIAGKYGLTWNTYSNHPPGMGPQPFYRERSVDWWGSGGRGDPIGRVWTKVAADARAMTGPDFDYMLTPQNDPQGHWDHVHLTAFTGKHGLKTATGSGKGGPNVDALIKKHIPMPPELGAGAIPGGLEEFMKKARESVVKKIKKHAPSGGSWNGKGNVDQWVKKGLTLGGAFPASNANIRMMVGRAMQESGGNPKAINNWDSNAAAGTPSKGLMQIIEPTWNSHTRKDIGAFDANWDNPIKSVAVSSRYMKSQYGHIVGANGQGYSKGGMATSPHLGIFGEGRGPGEVMWPLHDKRATRAITNAVKTGVQTRDTKKPRYYDVPEHQGVNVPGSRASKLYARGWRGRPGDGAERLYPPRNAGRVGYVQAEDGTWVPNSFYGRTGVGTPTQRQKQKRVNKATGQVFNRGNVRKDVNRTRISRNTSNDSRDKLTAKAIEKMTARLEAKLDEQLKSINIANMDKIIELSVKTALATILSKGGRDAIDIQMADKMEFDLGLKGIN